MSTLDRHVDRHEDAVVHAEARHLARVLAPYRVLSRERLRELAGAARWHQCSFERALAEAVHSGAIEELPAGFLGLVRG